MFVVLIELVSDFADNYHNFPLNNVYIKFLKHMGFVVAKSQLEHTIHI